MNGNIQDIYAIDLGRSYMLFNINSLERTFIAKDEVAKRGLLLQEEICANISYIEKYKPIVHKKAISPTIITSFKCNYACAYCFEKKLDRNMEVLRSEDIQGIIDFYKVFCERTYFPMQFEAITIMGGEPLLPENMEVLKSIANAWPEKRLKITTNGTYLEEYMDFIVQNNVQIKVSLDGTKETHYKRRKPSDVMMYDKTIQGVKKLIENKIDTTVVTVFCPENVGNYPRFFDLLENIGWLKVAELAVGFIPEIGIGGDDIPMERIMHSIDAFHRLKEMDKRTRYVDARKLIPGSISLIDALSLARQGVYEPYRCSNLEMPNYAFMPDGTVRLCAAIPNDIGYIGRYKPYVEIDFDKIEKFRQRRIDKMSKCRECSVKVICLGGCVATALSQKCDMLEGNCGFWKNPLFLEAIEMVF